MFLVQQPTMQWVDPQKNVPVQRGDMYFGQPNLDPKVVANRITVYYYNELGNLVELPQPIELSDSGVPVYLGKQVDIYINVNCSIRVDDKNGAEVYYVNEYTGSNEAGPLPSLRVDNLKQLATTPAAAGSQVNVTSFYSGWSASNGMPAGGGLFAWSSTIAKSLHNGVTVYAPEALAAWNGTQVDIATLLNWTGSGVGAWVRSSDELTISDCGAVLDGVAVNNLSVNKFASTFGILKIPSGVCNLQSITIDVPIRFYDGAALTVVAGEKITITNTVDSSRQFIFRGAGDYELKNDSNSGENARQVHASWFGAVVGLKQDQAPAINKAFSSFGNLRESVVDFDVGNYYLSSGVLVTRGGFVRGTGSRRTVFNALADGFDAFTTLGEACRFEGIQFEPEVPTTVRTSSWINIAHNNCVVKDVFAGRAFRSILTTGNNTEISDIGSFMDSSPPIGSSLIAVQSSNNDIHDVQLDTSSAFSQSFAVHLGANLGGSSTISGNTIERVSGTAPSVLVCVDASITGVTRTVVNSVLYNGSTGAAPDAVVKVVAGGSNNVEDLIIDGLIVSPYAQNGVLVENNGSGTIFDLSFDNVIVSGSAGVGISFVRNSGFINKVRIGSNVDVKDRLIPYNYSGANITQFKIDPMSIPNAMPSYCYDYSITDDSVAVIDLRRSVFTGWLMVSVGSSQYAVYVIRAASTPAVSAFGSPTSNMNTATTALTGTTGTDGKFTTGVTDGVLYFENRLGSTQRVNVILMTGVN